MHFAGEMHSFHQLWRNFMGKRKKTWLEIKATKKPEEWRRINRVYGQRRRLKNQLKVKGAELLNKIHNYRLIQNPGPADVLIDEVRKALRLPYSWNQEDYSHAEARLNDIEVNVAKLQKRMTPRSTELGNTLLMMVLQSKESDVEKAAALVSAVEYMANQLSTEKVEGLKNNKTNYVMTLLRTKDNYYPRWVVKTLFNNVLQLLKEEDLEKFTKMLMKVVIAAKNRADIGRMMEVERDDEVVIG